MSTLINQVVTPQELMVIKSITIHRPFKVVSDNDGFYAVSCQHPSIKLKITCDVTPEYAKHIFCGITLDHLIDGLGNSINRVVALYI